MTLVEGIFFVLAIELIVAAMLFWTIRRIRVERRGAHFLWASVRKLSKAEHPVAYRINVAFNYLTVVLGGIMFLVGIALIINYVTRLAGGE